MDIRQRSMDTATQLMKNNFMQKSPRLFNSANLNEDRKICANQPKANVFSPSPARVQKIASFYKTYLARIQSKIPLEPLRQNSTGATDQSAAQTILWYYCFQSHDLSADLHSLFNNSTNLYGSKSVVPYTLISSSPTVPKQPANKNDGERGPVLYRYRGV